VEGPAPGANSLIARARVPPTMPLAIPIGILANALLVAAVWSEIPVLGAVLMLANLVAVAGAALVLGGQRKLGARTVVAGSILFVPLGLIAVFGARRLLDDVAEDEFRRLKGGGS